jgi:hypothetical protein
VTWWAPTTGELARAQSPSCTQLNKRG